MTLYRYYRWDNTQDIFPLHGDDLMEELSDYLLSHGDVSTALKKIVQQGTREKFGSKLAGIQDLLRQLRSLKEKTLEKYDLNSVLNDLRQSLDKVIQKERGGIHRRLRETEKPNPEVDRATQGELRKVLERLASRKLEFLRNLPQDSSGALRELMEYDFMDPEAQQEFRELTNMLRDRFLDSYVKELSQHLKDLTPQAMAGLKEMLRSLNQLLRQKLERHEPDVKSFMERYGDYFGADMPETFEELMQRMEQQMARMQSLLNSLPEELRKTLQDLLQNTLDDGELRQILAQLTANLKQLASVDEWHKEYDFLGEEPLSLSYALELMERLQKMDQLEQQLKRTQYGMPLSDININEVREILGDDAYQGLAQLKDLASILEQGGYIRKTGNKFELTPKGMRKIGHKALSEIFTLIKKGRLGRHETNHKGLGANKADDFKKYEFGDPFLLDLHRTLMNSIARESYGVPIKIKPEDFEVYQTELLTQTSTVLMLDLSLSMAMRGNFLAAKKVALALESLMRTLFPRDNLYIVGFSTYAREVTSSNLPYLSWDEFDPYTNMQHGFVLSQKLLTKDKSATKQIIMISDGEPTAHMEGDQLFLQYPPSPRTIKETLREVKRCTQKGIVINTFMLDRSAYLVEFVEQFTKINKGRVFYTSPENLGQYLLVDYLTNQRRKILS